jgi:hypothetical protein
MTKFVQNISVCKFARQKPEVVEQLKIHSNLNGQRTSTNISIFSPLGEGTVPGLLVKYGAQSTRGSRKTKILYEYNLREVLLSFFIFSMQSS